MARSFASASSQYLSSSSSFITSSPITIAAWVYPLQTSAVCAVVTIQQAGGLNRFMLYCGPSAEVSFQTSNASSFPTATASTNYAANEWCHVAGVSASASSRYAYRNGVPGAQETTACTPSSIDRVYVGVTSASAYYFNGRIAELGVWSVALTTAEIAALSSGYTPLEIRPASLVAYYPLGGHYGQSDVDRWENKYDLTPSGSPTWADHPRVIYSLPSWGPIKATAASSTKYWLFGSGARRIIGGGIGT